MILLIDFGHLCLAVIVGVVSLFHCEAEISFNLIQFNGVGGGWPTYSVIKGKFQLL